MCLHNRQSCNTAMLDAYKLFHYDNEMKIYSAFRNVIKIPYKNGYNACICDKYDLGFYSCSTIEDCKKILFNDYWNLDTNIVIVPVKLHNVVYEGFMFQQNEDSQCMDTYIKCYISTGLEVYFEQKYIDMTNSLIKEYIKKHLSYT